MRLIYENDQLAFRTGVSDQQRLRWLEAAPLAIDARDDLCISYTQLLIAAGRSEQARDMLAHRNFQPWEGGEGQVLTAWAQACSAMAEQALSTDRPAEAVELVNDALHPPRSLGEARHPRADTSGLHLLLGDALAASGDSAAAERAWQQAAPLRSRQRHGLRACANSSGGCWRPLMTADNTD